MTAARFLSCEEKARELAEWRRTKAGPLPDRSDLGGRGYPDPPVFGLVDSLNAIPGVCTLQSCCGHSPSDSEGAIYPGCLWLRLDMDMAHYFESVAQILAANPLIERVGKHWQPDGREVVEIIFHGVERGKFGESAAVILEMFLSATCQR